jgi:hypothetical protein
VVSSFFFFSFRHLSSLTPLPRPRSRNSLQCLWQLFLSFRPSNTKSPPNAVINPPQACRVPP